MNEDGGFRTSRRAYRGKCSDYLWRLDAQDSTSHKEPFEKIIQVLVEARRSRGRKVQEVSRIKASGEAYH